MEAPRREGSWEGVWLSRLWQVTQVLLGATSCAVGALLYLGYGTDLRASGCAFWAGFAVSKEGIVSSVGGQG